jgi:hypothetical protein
MRIFRNQEQWQTLIEDQKSSGLTVNVWGNASNLGLYSKVRDTLSCQVF